MSFENAPVSKGFMVAIALTSILVGVFDIKHYFHLQLVPHMSRHHQYWRLAAHHLAFSNSTDLFLSELLMYNIGVQIERQFGSLKFASFAVVATLLSTTFNFLALVLFHRLGLNFIPSGPVALIFSIIYQYSRIVPSVYSFRVFGVPLNNKSFNYVLALQLAISHLPGSGVAAIVGVLTGQIYRSDLTNFKGYRLPPSIVRFSNFVLRRLVGSTRAPRRTNRAFPDVSRTGSVTANAAPAQNDEVITTARTPTPSGGGATSRVRPPPQDPSAEIGASVVREWVNELTGRTDRANAGIRIPPDTEVTHLTNMFPDIPRETVVGALQRSPNIEAAVETLLSSQR